MGWKREGDRIIIDLTQEQWEVLLYALGAATGTADDAPRWQIMMLDLVNAINEGKPAVETLYEGRKMKLSEAIRLGAMIRPQGYRTYWSSKGGSCALGAALEATGYDFPSAGFGVPTLTLQNYWPFIWRIEVKCPGGCPGNMELPKAIITHLNDDHCWTRERIADWIATIEPAEEAAIVEPAQEVLCEAQ